MCSSTLMEIWIEGRKKHYLKNWICLYFLSLLVCNQKDSMGLYSIVSGFYVTVMVTPFLKRCFLVWGQWWRVILSANSFPRGFKWLETEIWVRNWIQVLRVGGGNQWLEPSLLLCSFTLADPWTHKAEPMIRVWNSNVGHLDSNG